MLRCSTWKDPNGPKLRSLSASAAASLARTAMVTCPDWPYWYNQLVDAAEHALSADLWATGQLSPTFWDPPPLLQVFDMLSLDFLGTRDGNLVPILPLRKFTKVLIPWSVSTEPE